MPPILVPISARRPSHEALRSLALYELEPMSTTTMTTEDSLDPTEQDSSVDIFDVLLYPSHNPFNPPEEQIIQFASETHPGNRRFLVLLDLYRPLYAKATMAGDKDTVKTICSDIVDRVRWTVPPGTMKEWILDDDCDNNSYSENKGELGDTGGTYGDVGVWEDLGSGSAAAALVLRGLSNTPVTSQFELVRTLQRRSIVARNSVTIFLEKDQEEEKMMKKKVGLRKKLFGKKTKENESDSGDKRSLLNGKNSAEALRYVRSRRQIDVGVPASSLNANDVLLGSQQSSHEKGQPMGLLASEKMTAGNRRLLSIVRYYKASFDEAGEGDPDKQNAFVAEIAATIYRGYDGPGRFLEEVPDVPLKYREVSCDDALSAIKHLMLITASENKAEF